ncbi:MAG TPA: response regulator [Candidatus Saccharimonadales bacterium]|nr:response regulator [Candidatus Saccharimonadales bacterium]
MSKILLVEDDNNLREIYEARLQAEGYEIVSAKDGEEALVVAKNEKPDLVISDVMMPKISGFEMLDILRNTDGLKDIKTIMLTALGQAEDKTRADSLGADRYLVKSQVTLEDIVKTAHELLNDSPSLAVAAVADNANSSGGDSAPASDSSSVTPAAAPAPVVDMPVSEPPAAPSEPVAAPAPAVQPEPSAPVSPAPEPPQTPSVTPAPAAEPAVPPSSTTPEPANDLVSSAQSSAQEEAKVTNQIEDFINTNTNQTTPTVGPVTPAPAAEPAIPASPSSNDVAMQSAIDTLVASTQPAADRPSDVQAVDVSTTTPPAAPVDDASAVPAANTTDAPSTADTSSDGNAPIAHKKIIQPLDTSDNPKPDLAELAAAEDAKEQAAAQFINDVTPPPAAPTSMPDPIQPTQAPSEDQPSQGSAGPVQAPAAPSQGSDFDPNNIAL